MMKFLICSIVLLVAPLSAQQTTEMPVEPMLSMADTYQKRAPVGSQYFAKGSQVPFTGVLFGRYANGEIMTTQDYVDGIGQGTWANYDPDGRISEQGTYKNNRVEGPVTQFYEDGSVKARGQYQHWKKPIGEWTYYDRQGNVVHQMRYTP